MSTCTRLRWRAAAELRKENEEGFELLDKYGGFELLQACFKAYRTDNGIVQFKKSLASQGYDLKK